MEDPCEGEMVQFDSEYSSFCYLSGTDIAGRIVVASFADDSPCSVQQIVSAAERGGASCLIFKTLLVSLDGVDVNIKVGVSSSIKGLLDYFDYFTFTDTTLPSSLTPDILSEFSSKGPTEDGRFKPDVVSVGEIFSAHSNGIIGGLVAMGHCEEVYMSGTSMATPITAGTAALLRQYIEEGRLMDGITSTNTPSPFQPTAALLKALLMHGARSTSFFTPSGGRNTDQTHLPNSAVGFGVVDLSYLPVGAPLTSKDACEPDHKAYARDQCGSIDCCAWDDVRDKCVASTSDSTSLCHPQVAADGPGWGSVRVSQSRAVGDGDVDPFCVSVSGSAGSFLWVTLVWTDPPGSLAADRALVNDLDLDVIGPDGAVFYGNNLTSQDESYHRVFRDQFNNAEQIRVPLDTLSTSPAKFLVRVKGFDVPDGYYDADKQKYALVISAPSLNVLSVDECLDLLQSPDITACHRDCAIANGAQCVHGTCLCANPQYSGPDCTLENTRLDSSSSPHRATLSANGWSYYTFADSPGGWDLCFWSGNGDPQSAQLMVAWNKMPSMHEYDGDDDGSQFDSGLVEHSTQDHKVR